MRIVADVGGTKTLLALVDERNTLQNITSFASQKYATFSLIIEKYLQSVGRPPLTCGCFAIAGPIVEGRSHLTNLQWDISAAALSQEFAIPQVTLLNDLEAQCYSLDVLPPESLLELQKGEKIAGNRAVISPGTGLGEAALFWDGERYHPFATEGGHADFGPQNSLQLELASFLLQQFPHLSYERLLSGAGIHNIYHFLVATKKGSVPPEVVEAIKNRDPAKAISQAAIEGKCKLCDEVLNLFMTILGQEAGNCALKFMAHGGVFVGGGVAAKLFMKFKEPFFLEGFLSKGRFAPLLKELPIHIILDEQAVLKGAASFICYSGSKGLRQ